MPVRILQGDCRDVLKTLPDESVHCVVTSPPYWGLRDYGTATWEGGDSDCQHEARQERRNAEAQPGVTQPGSLRDGVAGVVRECHCGARRVDSQIGLEESPEAFVASLLTVFSETRRVLRSDGTLWLNLGDSYAGVGAQTGGMNSKEYGRHADRMFKPGISWRGMKQKDLVGIPWRTAFALQADGWYLRNDIIWHKPNPMPESVTDRCTKSHEYMFLLAKAERYYFDAKAIAEPLASDPESWGRHNKKDPGLAAVNPRPMFGPGRDDRDGTEWGDGETRNKRSVWTVTTKPFSEAHFATFPPDLIQPCILAGCPVGGTVLDPFGGAGTTGLVADRHGRDAILIELNPEYAEMARKRITNDAPLFAEVR